MGAEDSIYGYGGSSEYSLRGRDLKGHYFDLFEPLGWCCKKNRTCRVYKCRRCNYLYNVVLHINRWNSYEAPERTCSEMIMRSALE